MSRVRLRPKAREDIVAIGKYSRRHWGAGQAAAYLRALDTAIHAAAAHPLRAPEAHPPYRKLTVGSHLIFYRVEADGIVVVRVLHQRMDARSRLP